MNQSINEWMNEWMKKVAVTRVDKNEFFSDEKELIIQSFGYPVKKHVLATPSGV